MKKLQNQKINKLFFNKWPYKIACVVAGASKVKYAGPANIRIWANSSGDNYFWEDTRWSIGYGRKKKPIDKFELVKFANAVEPFMSMKDDVQIRAEGHHFNIFCKDMDLKEKMCEALYPWIKEVHGPETKEELEFMLGNNKKVLCNHLPYGKYKFKVVLKDWVENPKKKEALYTFLYKHQESETVKISGGSLQWLAGNKSYKQDPFFYLTDDKQLVFVRLMFDEIKNVYEYVERDGINTVLQ